MQLPSVQLDAFVESTQELYIGNRNPQPGEAQIPANAPIVFDMFGSFSLSTVEIIINGDGAYLFGTFLGGWTGTVEVGVPDVNTTRFTFVSPTPFETGQRVDVVAAQDSRWTTWSFYSFDLIPPLLSAVAAQNKDQILVTFNEPVSMGGTSAGDALNPASYTIERLSRPAVVPTVQHVDYVSPTQVMLTTSMELSFGAQYMLVVAGVSDEFGNVFHAPDNVKTFNGWLPPFPAGRQWLLHNFVPRMSLAEDQTQDLVLFLGCLQDTTNLLLYMIDKWIELIDPDLAPEAFVDAMLEDLGNPFTFELDVTQKRKLAKTLLRIYQLKGTAIGIIAVVRFFVGIEVTIETYTGQGWRLGYDKLSSPLQVASPNPAIIGAGQHAIYSFRVLTTVVLTDKQRDEVRAIAIYMKGAQEHLVGIRDGSPLPTVYKYWIVGKTKIGYVKISDGVVPPPPSVFILSFTIAEPV